MTKRDHIGIVGLAMALVGLSQLGCGDTSKNGAMNPAQAGTATGGNAGAANSAGSATLSNGGTANANGGAQCVDSQGQAPGSVDTTFGKDGTATLIADLPSDGNEDIFRSLIRANNGELFAMTESGNSCALFKLDENGKPVTTFGNQGRADYAFKLSGYCLDLSVDTQGRVLLAGTNLDDALIARFTATGTLDTTFGAEGTVTLDLGSNNDRFGALIVRADESLAAVGTANSNAPIVDNFVALFGADGALLGGKPVALDVGAGRQFTAALAELTDHSLLVLGENQTSSSAFFSELDANGAPVPSFGQAGWQRSADKSFGGVFSLLLNGDQATGWGFAPSYQVARFGSDGSYSLFTMDKSVSPMSVAPECDGKLIVSGMGPDVNGALARLSADGSLDSSFAPHSWPKGDKGSQANRVLLQSDGRILVGGNDGGRPFVARFWP